MNWNNIRALNGDQRHGFEELCCQLASREPEVKDATFIRKGIPDGGIECYAKFADNTEWGWQAKFVHTLGQTQWTEIDRSVQTALATHPRLTKYFICLPLNLPDSGKKNHKTAQKKWDEKVAEWSKGRNIEFVLWNEHELVKRIEKIENRGILFFWFHTEVFTEEWFKKKVEDTIVNVGPRFTSLLDIAVPLYRNFEGLGNIDGYLNESKKALHEFKRQLKLIQTTITGGYALDKAIVESLNHLTDDLSEWNPSTFSLISTSLESIADQVSNWVETLPGDQQTATDRETLHNRGWWFRNNLYELRTSLRNEALLAAEKRALLVVGHAGSGKTHLFAHIAKNRIEKHLATLFLEGKYFQGNLDPISAIRDIFGLNCTHEEFLGALNAAGECQEKPILILIDAINEGKGRDIWKDQLPRFLNQVLAYPFLSVALSVRNEFENLLIQKHISDRFARVEHHGFGEFSLEAALKFFEFYEIQNPDIPILLPEFENPLFLKFYCESVKSGKIPRRGLSELAFKDVLDGFVAMMEERISGNLGVRSAIGIVKKATKLIAQEMGKDGWGTLSAPVVLDLLAENITAVPADRLLNEMASEGLLNETISYYSPTDPRDIISFAYERLGDFLIAEEALRLYPIGASEVVDEKHGLWKYLKSDLSCNHFSGLMKAFAVLIPEKFGRDLFEFAPHIAKAYEICEATIESVLWRKKESISGATVKYLRKTAQRFRATHESWIETLIMLAPVPNHPFNVDYLSTSLQRLSIVERDAEWSILIHNFWEYHSSTIRRIIHWGTKSELHSLVSADYRQLAARTLIWFFTSANRELRDLSTKAVSLLLADNLSSAKAIYLEFKDIDDPYILERVMCALYAAVMTSTNLDGFEDLAETVFETFFKDHETPTSHILTRDYARGIIDFGIRTGRSKINPTEIMPPYGSDWNPDALPTTESFKPVDKPWDERSAEERAYVHLYGSIFGFEDFARYIIGTNHSGSSDWSSLRLSDPIPDQNSEYYRLPPFDLSLVQRAVMNRTIELGWNGEKFGEFDDSLNRHRYDRAANKPERIGKKYQWIGFRETQGLLADNFRYSDHNGEAPYDGPWQLGYERDIDPTLPLSKSFGEHMHDQSRTWWSPCSVNDWGKESLIEEWLEDQKNLPIIESILEVKDTAGEEWINLSSYNAWSELSSDVPDRFDIPSKDVWYIIRGFFVDLKFKDKVVSWMRHIEDASNGRMESHVEIHDCFYRELYWSRAYEYAMRYNPEFYLEYSGKTSSPSPLRMVGIDFTHESGGYDCSISDTISFRCPAGWLYSDLNLKPDNRVGVFSDSSGIVIQDPSVYTAGPSSLLIRKKNLLKYLSDKGLAVVWCIIGEKLLIRPSIAGSHGPYLRGIYSMDSSGTLNGKFVQRKNGW